MALLRGHGAVRDPSLRQMTPLGSDTENGWKCGAAVPDEARNGRLRLALPLVEFPLLDPALDPGGVGGMFNPRSKSATKFVLKRLP